MATSDIPFASIAEVMDEVYEEAAIVLPGPPIQIFAQRAAPTIVLKSMKQHCGKFYYECKTLTGGYMQVGWADDQFKASSTDGKGAGDDSHSWSYDGYRCLKWHANKKEGFGSKWKAGDIIGVAIDLDGENALRFSLNGDWGAFGIAFENIAFSEAVFPAITLLRGERVELNLGLPGNKFVYEPPSDDYSALTITRQMSTGEKADKFCGFTSVIEMGMSETSFIISFPGEIMVNVMGRGLAYEAKKNALIHAGYEATLKCWEHRKEVLTQNTEGMKLTNDEIFAIICYTLQDPPVYRYFNNDTRKGYKGDGMDFPIISHLLREGCRKLLGAVPQGSCTRTVYRGVGMQFNAIVGQTIRFGSYTSTTESKNVADGFMSGGSCGTIFVLNTKLGAPIKIISIYPHEEEVLVPPYEIFKVNAIVKSTPIKIYLESTFDDAAIPAYVENGSIPHQ